MNVFEDLIVELKEENLLELTVIDADKKEKTETTKPEAGEASEESGQPPVFDAPEDEADSDSVELESFDQAAEAESVNIEVVDLPSAEEPAKAFPEKSKKVRHGKEFFKKRAVDEVASHQMVEHILTGVEREYMKAVPKTFDDFNAKKALHVFINIAENSNSEEHKSAEFALMQETEAWGLALLERDCRIPASLIRQYCEHSKPALSSQAMLALARFYRNAPYSESVRAKFDFVITRLFSRPMEHDRRLCLFSRDEMVGHVSKLYGEWSSIPLYSADSDESNVLLTGLSFEDFASEAERAPSFDQLVESDFFGRLRLFKESISELFYEPSVTASAIESNVRVGNACVNLIVKERQKMDAASIQSKYGDFNDPSFSDAAGRTLDLAEVLSGLTDEAMKAEEAAEEPDDSVITVDSEKAEPKIETVKVREPIVAQVIGGFRTMNRWLLVVGAMLVIISGGLYIYSAFFMVDEQVSTAGVTNVELESNPLFAEHLKLGRISGDRFYGYLKESWNALPKEKRQEYLQKLLQAGAEKNFRQVSLISSDGKTEGFASPERIDVTMP
ncbi:MAG: hypothetical protein ACKVRN_01485 [Pyrinomonadaceae bacterium]